jgi:hypothetical protein
MLSLSKHLYRAARVTTANDSGEMLRFAQHDVLFDPENRALSRLAYQMRACSAVGRSILSVGLQPKAW